MDCCGFNMVLNKVVVLICYQMLWLWEFGIEFCGGVMYLNAVLLESCNFLDSKFIVT